MADLHDIELAMAPYRDALNSTIADTLKCDNKLMTQIVDNYLKTKGKQLRPLLVFISGDMNGGINDDVTNAAAAIELLHNASLIHDDVIDQASLRRGSPTINSVWSNHIAVLVGDFFVAGALQCAARTRNQDVLDTLAAMGRDLSLGEVNQYDIARSHDITEATYYDIIGKKTASLFESCVTVGAQVKGASSEIINDLRRYARLLGLCFQIKDDTFDYFHNDAIGKPTGNDLREGKVTLPLIYALSRTDLPEQPRMAALVAQDTLTDDQIDQLVEFAKRAGGIDYARQAMERMYDEACTILAPYAPSTAVDRFITTFRFVIDRNS